MTQESSGNVAASVRDRLLNLAHQQHEPFDLILVRYALERLLYRLGVSDWRQRFVVKGAMSKTRSRRPSGWLSQPRTGWRQTRILSTTSSSFCAASCCRHPRQRLKGCGSIMSGCLVGRGNRNELRLKRLASDGSRTFLFLTALTIHATISNVSTHGRLPWHLVYQALSEGGAALS